MKSFETFLQLHRDHNPLLLGNIWDVNSASIFEDAGYKAIGTSSQAVAASLGYEDGERMPFEDLLQLAKSVTRRVNIPLTVDIEGGYSRSVTGIVENIEKLHDIGVVGINLEDTIAGTTRQLQPAAAFQITLSAVAEQLSTKNVKMFINVRTDGFLMGMPTALAETLTRIASYQKAGAQGIFVPCITDKDDITAVVSATPLPVNVMCMPELPDFDELKALGVKRISIGPFVKTYIDKKAKEAVSTILRKNTFSGLFNSIILVLGFSFLLASCTNNGNPITNPNLTEAKAAIAVSNALYFESFEKNDSSIFINSYAKDACIMAPDAPQACGREEAVKFFRAAYDSYGLRGGKFITTAVYGDGGDYVTEEGLWQSLNERRELFDNGKFLVLWKKTPDGWKMFRDSFSANHNPKH
jgi:2-methylisocitrate lyase-like PEP mutase family enzyme/ketosteroid isomerase-like protein